MGRRTSGEMADKGFVGNQSMTHREMTGEAGEGYSARANEVSPH
jgi:hypothetical protein